MRLRLKLSRRETALAVLSGLVLFLALIAAVGARREATAQGELAAQVRRIRLNLVEVQQSADTATLEARKGEITAALAQVPPLRVDGSDVTLSLWKWARDSDISIESLDYGIESVKVADVTVVAHKYALSLRGRADGLHRLLALAVSSTYNPLVEKLGLRHQLGAATWDARLELTVYSQ